jgi:hypothetical protein
MRGTTTPLKLMLVLTHALLFPARLAHCGICCCVAKWSLAQEFPA